MKKDKLKINTSFLSYSNKDVDKIEIRSDKSFIQTIWDNKPTRKRVQFIGVIIFIILII